MAAGDYRSCDVCGGKAFYDANLNYESGDKVDGQWVYPADPFRVAGFDQQPYGAALDMVGDWAVICTGCAKTHKCVVVPLASEGADQ